MAASTAFTRVPACSSSVCEARHGQHASRKLAHRLCFGSRRLDLTLRPQGPSAFRSPLLSIAASSEFANKISPQFREFLAEELGKYDYLSDARGRIAEVCAKALHNYASTYSGGIDAKPVEDMKTALIEQGLPHQQALLCSVWWLRVNLRRDWEQYCAAK
ncbi:hypothetical protein GOP47_0017580 [Adiantum capillus-veneris]|uniref:Uncharacterized protein n=1 Tax=Adiantum capillus-veneris TaxID=13818 RepID=A0A9D4UG28_ADICA|nr:hypothetical protein GOP47_0017580 [Adiantum capillus-veneris]